MQKDEFQRSYTENEGQMVVDEHRLVRCTLIPATHGMLFPVPGMQDFEFESTSRRSQDLEFLSHAERSRYLHKNIDTRRRYGRGPCMRHGANPGVIFILLMDALCFSRGTPTDGPSCLPTPPAPPLSASVPPPAPACTAPPSSWLSTQCTPDFAPRRLSPINKGKNSACTTMPALST